jgi:DNA modification methylase
MAATEHNKDLKQDPKRGSVPRVPVPLLQQLPEGILQNLLDGGAHEPSTVVRDGLLEKYNERLVHRPEYKSLTTSTPDKDKPITGWFFYKEAFASALVERIIRESALQPSAQILDPFGGVGTVPFVSQMLGFQAVSVDMSPLPVFITNTKLKAAQRDCSLEVLALGRDVLQSINGGGDGRELPDVSIWSKAFDVEVAHGLFDALERIQYHRNNGIFADEVCDIVHLALLCVAEEVSHTVKDGTSLRLREPGRRLGRAGITKTVQDLRRRLDNQFSVMARDVQCVSSNLLERGATTPESISHLGDARRLTDLFQPQSFDLVVTSPPYPNRYDYSAIYTLELLLGFIRDRDELRSLRFDLFRSHLEAPWPTDLRGLTPAVEEILGGLYFAGMSSPRVFKMLLGYFSDIDTTVEQLMLVMKSGAKAFFVVGNVRIEGQEVPVDLILADIAERIGFEIEEITVARFKGTNSQQAKKFGAGRLRESIVVFRKP